MTTLVPLIDHSWSDKQRAVGKRKAAVRWIALHCSATPEGKDYPIEEIDRWHRVRGFTKIGYHFVIHLDGRIEAGRRLDEIGAHVSGYNSTSIGICYIGGLDAVGKAAKDTRTDAQKTATETLIKHLLTLPDVAHARVLGHRNFPKVAKDCPSFDAITWAQSRKLPAGF